MWPFIKKFNLPGFKKDNQGNLMFELTEEEKQEVQKVSDFLKNPEDPEGKFYAKQEVAEEMGQVMIAMGLFNYAKDQIMLSEFDSNRINKKEFIDKAIASISKAFSFCPLPIYMYDLACFLEMNGENNKAKKTFKSFLELQDNFKPSEIQKILLNAQARDIDEAIKDAKKWLTISDNYNYRK
jgi:hypothetical protein